jgi:hypothetical protein
MRYNFVDLVKVSQEDNIMTPTTALHALDQLRRDLEAAQDGHLQTFVLADEQDDEQAAARADGAREGLRLALRHLDDFYDSPHYDRLQEMRSGALLATDPLTPLEQALRREREHYEVVQNQKQGGTLTARIYFQALLQSLTFARECLQARREEAKGHRP